MAREKRGKQHGMQQFFCSYFKRIKESGLPGVELAQRRSAQLNRICQWDIQRQDEKEYRHWF